MPIVRPLFEISLGYLLDWGGITSKSIILSVFATLPLNKKYIGPSKMGT